MLREGESDQRHQNSLEDVATSVTADGRRFDCSRGEQRPRLEDLLELCSGAFPSTPAPSANSTVAPITAPATGLKHRTAGLNNKDKYCLEVKLVLLFYTLSNYNAAIDFTCELFILFRKPKIVF